MPLNKINAFILALTFSLPIILLNLAFEINSEVGKSGFSSHLLGNKEAFAQEPRWTNYMMNNGNDGKLNTGVPPDWQVAEDNKNETGLNTNTAVFISPKE